MTKVVSIKVAIRPGGATVRTYGAAAHGRRRLLKQIQVDSGQLASALANPELLRELGLVDSPEESSDG